MSAWIKDGCISCFLQTGFFVNWVTAIVWPFAKLSFFLLYIQLFRPMKWLRYCSYAGATVNVLFYASVLIATFAFTVPGPGQTLQQVVQSPREARARTLPIPVASMSLVLDVYILILPVAGVSQLQLPIRRKVGVIAVFFTGVMCVAQHLLFVPCPKATNRTTEHVSRHHLAFTSSGSWATTTRT